MGTLKLAINGFGRIGRLTARVILNNPNVELVAINDLTNANTLAHLFKYDTAHGSFNGTISADGNDLVINGKKGAGVCRKRSSEFALGRFRY